MKKSANMFLVFWRSLTFFHRETQIFELSAKKYEYSPSPVHVKTGSKFNSKLPPQIIITVSKLRLFSRATNRAAPGLVFDKNSSL
jgi:hypothetical protein